MLIISVALINAFMPPITLAIQVVFRNARRSWDQKRFCRRNPPENTAQKTFFSYKELYSGDEFEIHYQYAHMLVIIFVTLLFGPGMPLLFPIGMMSLMILYGTTRVQLAYFSKRPPAYNSIMTFTTINLLKFAPYLYVCYGAWLFSNQQVFRDKVQANTDWSIFSPCDHYFSQFFTQVTPGSVFLLFPVIKVFGWILKYCLRRSQVDSWFTHMDHIEKQVVEQDLPSVYSTMSIAAREDLIREEVISRQRLNFSKLSQHQILALAKEPEAELDLQITGDQSYRTLWHKEFAEKLNYSTFTNGVISNYRKPEFR